MSKTTRSGYLKAASRFLGLAAGAADDDDKEGAAEGSGAEASAEEPEEDKGKKGKKGKGGKDCPDAEDDEGDEEARAAEDDEDEDDEKDEKGKAAAQARAAERARWAAVLSSAEAKGRGPLACSLLADTDMPEDKIRSALLASPAHGEPVRGLAARMAEVPRVEVGSGPAARAPDASSPAGQAASILASYESAIGRKPEAR